MKTRIDESRSRSFAALYLLDCLEEGDIPLLLGGNDEFLEVFLTEMQVKGYAEIDRKKGCWIPSEKGRDIRREFRKKYSEYLTLFDIFCAVDLSLPLGEGSFAFSRYFDFSTDGQWENYLNDPRWEDIRIAVARFKGMDPVEIVFMSFLNEGRFGRDGEGWQFDLLLGSVWNEIAEICDGALTEEELEQTPLGEAAFRETVALGSEIMLKLLKAEEDNAQNGSPEDSCFDDGYEEVVCGYGYGYFAPYRDPFYVSPLWLAPLVLF